jgi:hypothetical protein
MQARCGDGRTCRCGGEDGIRRELVRLLCIARVIIACVWRPTGEVLPMEEEEAIWIASGERRSEVMVKKLSRYG